MNPLAFYLTVLAINLGLSGICFLKGKFWLGAISLVIGGVFVSIWGVCRLAKPGSWWTTRLYDTPKRARVNARYAGTAQPAGGWQSEYVAPPIAEMFR
jgi:hypothetical protein